MKRLAILMCMALVFSTLFSSFASAAPTETVEPSQQIVLPDLGITPKAVSKSTADEIDAILEKMNSVALLSDDIAVASDISLSAKSNQLQKLDTEYNKLEAEALSLGCIFLTDEQAAKYVYGTTESETASGVTTQGISYPSISGINFAITYYTYSGNQMAKCTATHKTGYTSKLVKNYDAVEMYGNTKYSDLAKKGIKMGATKLINYLLGQLDNKVVTFAVNNLSKLPGAAFPSSSSSSQAKLSLQVSSRSTVVHIWRYMNNTDYYLRTATVSARINETWTLRDVNGNHYVKTHSYDSESSYYNNNQQALNVSSPTSYGIYQQYKTQGLFGIYWQKQEVSPFIAALPIHFA